MAESPQNNSKHGILSLTIKDLNVLHSAYMPFIKNGGLFIPTTKQYDIGDEVFVLLNLMDEVEKIPVACSVVWITPSHALGNKAQGIGVQFKEKDNEAREKIETHLAGLLNSEKPSHTL